MQNVQTWLTLLDSDDAIKHSSNPKCNTVVLQYKVYEIYHFTDYESW